MSGLYMPETKLGEMITGRIPGSHLSRQCPQPGSISFCQVQRSYRMNQEASELVSSTNQEPKMEIVSDHKSSWERDPDFQNPFNNTDVIKIEEPGEQSKVPFHEILTPSACQEGPEGSVDYLPKRMNGRYSSLRKLLWVTAKCRKFLNIFRRNGKPQEDWLLFQKSVPRRIVPITDSQGSDS